MLFDYAVLYVLTRKKLFTEKQIKVLPPSCLFDDRSCIGLWAESVWMEGCVDDGIGVVSHFIVFLLPGLQLVFLVSHSNGDYKPTHHPL